VVTTTLLLLVVLARVGQRERAARPDTTPDEDVRQIGAALPLAQPADDLAPPEDGEQEAPALLGPRGALEQEVRQVLRRALVAEGTAHLPLRGS
jgi:hypothetical protein